MSDENDFGFTAVDEEELGGLVAPPPAPQVVAVHAPADLVPVTTALAELKAAIAALKPASSTQVSRVEEKIDRVLNAELQELNATLQSQGQSLDSIMDEVEERTAVVRDECKAKLLEVERLILPLLHNLMKNPEKEYILWRNRSEKISTQIDKITAVTRSMGT
jgi:hypothetical protein